MKLLLELGGKAWLLNLSWQQVQVHLPGDDDEELSDDRIEHLPVDPHGTTMAHLERRSAMEDLYDHHGIPFGFSRYDPKAPDGSGS